MEEKSQNLQQSIDFFESKCFTTYKEWLDSNLILRKQSALFLFHHIDNFVTTHSDTLQMERFLYLEKLFELALELKLVQVAKIILYQFSENFGKETKITKMQAQLSEIADTDRAHEFYKVLIISNQDDRVSLKKYIGLLKSSFSIVQEDLKKLIEMWNEYLKVYMDDHEAWYELSDVYLLASNYTKAVYCLEEVLIHQPNNFNIYTKLGDILCTLNTAEAAVNAVKYYSQSVLIHPTPRAFWGMVTAINIYLRYSKGKDENSNIFPTKEKLRSMLKIAKINLENFYSKSPIKFSFENFCEI